jgi:hypothetical protein
MCIIFFMILKHKKLIPYKLFIDNFKVFFKFLVEVSS